MLLLALALPAVPQEWSAGTTVDAAPTSIAANLDQCRNGDFDHPVDCLGATWVNGNAGAQNAHYVEGGSIAYRMRLTGLTANNDYTLVMSYNITHSGAEAIDYLTSVAR